MNGWKRKMLPDDWDILLVILFLALALRAYFAVAFDTTVSVGYEDDFVAMSSNNIPAAEGAPKYPLILKHLLGLSGGSLVPVYLINTILGSAAVVMLYYAGSMICSRRAGIAAALIAALYPGFILYTISPTPAAPLIFLSSALILLGSTGDPGGIKSDLHSAAAGLAAAAGVVIEPAFAFVIPGLIATARSRFTLIIVIAGVLVPMAISHSTFEREIVPLYKEVYWRIDLGKFHGDDLTGGWRVVRKLYENAALITSRGWAEGSAQEIDSQRNSTYTAAYSYVAIMILGLVGLAGRFRREQLPVLLPMLIYFLLLVLFTVFRARYRIVLEPLLILYAGALLGGRCGGGSKGRETPSGAV